MMMMMMMTWFVLRKPLLGKAHVAEGVRPAVWLSLSELNRSERLKASKVAVVCKGVRQASGKGLVPLELGGFKMSVGLKGSIEAGSGTDRAAQREGTEQL